MKKKLLFITYWYPPFQVIGAQRASSFVKYLEKEGWDIAVVTVKNHKWAFNGRRSFSNSVAGEKIYRLKGLNIAETLKRFSFGRLKGAGQSISDIGTSRETLKSRLYSFYNNVVSFPDECSFWYFLNKKKIAKIANEFEPDIIFSSALPACSHLLAAKAQIACGAPWVAEYRDLWSGNPLKGRSEKSETKHRRLEVKTVSNACHLISVSKPLAQELNELHDKPTDVIYNGYDSDEFTLKERSRNKRFTVVYTGMIYPQKQHPEFFFQALSKLKSNGFHSDIEFKYYGPNKSMMDRLADEYNVRDMCKINNSVDRDVALKEQHCADQLLFFSFDVEGCLSGKLFEYLGSLNPILIVGKEDPELKEIVIQNNAGVQCETSDKIVKTLIKMVGIKNKDKKSTNEEWRLKYSRRALSLRLSSIFKRYIKSDL